MVEGAMLLFTASLGTRPSMRIQITTCAEIMNYFGLSRNECCEVMLKFTKNVGLLVISTKVYEKQKNNCILSMLNVKTQAQILY